MLLPIPIYRPVASQFLIDVIFTSVRETLTQTPEQCATGNPVPVVPVDFFRSGFGPVPAKYRPDLSSKFGCRI